MAFWGSNTIKKRQVTDYIVLPFDDNNIKHGRYHLSVGPESYITVDDVKKEIDLNGQISIESGQFAIILTEETVNIPKNAIGFISIRAGIKFKGLVNVSGFHVDPGYSGRLKFAVYNAGPRNIILSRGQSAFLIWFCDMDDDTDPYDGEHKDQRHITADDVFNLQGQIASPNALKKEIDALKQTMENNYDKLSNRLTIWTSIAVAIFMLLAGISVKEYFFNKGGKTESTQPQRTPSTPQK
jgi:dCTP deaminase